MINKPNSSLNNFEEEHSEAQSTAACYPSYASFESNSPHFSNSPYQDTDSLSDKSKKIRKKRNTYQKIDDDTRILLLDAVKQGDTLKAAAKRYNINYSSAKSILHTFRKEGRILKKSAQERTARKRTKSSQNLEMSPIYLYNQKDDFLGNSDSPNFQAFYPMENKFQFEHQPQYEIQNEEENRGMNPIGINTFGGYLKVNSQAQQNHENVHAKNPASTLVLKLESQPLYGQSYDTNKVPSNRNWQLNVNVHSDGIEKAQRNYTYPPENKVMTNAPEKFKVFDPIYMNSSMYSNSPLFRQNLTPREQREEPIYNQPQNIQNTYNHYDYNPNNEMMNFPAQEQGYDVSCFLNSSPNYSFPNQKGTELGQYNNIDHSYSKGVILEPQEVLYDGSTKGAYHYYKPGANLTNSLKSY